MSLTVAACDPCAGIANCARGDFLAATGQVVEAENGHGVDGTRLEFMRVGGIEIASDSLTVISGEGGFWKVEFTPMAPGDLVVDVHVSPPGEEGYFVRSLVLHTREHGGDANLNQRWVTRLYFNYMGELYYKGTEDNRVANRPVTFRQTGGVALYGPGITDSAHVTSTDPAGRVNLFPTGPTNGVFAREESALTGNLDVTLPDGRISRLTGVTLVPTHLYQQPPYVARAPVSP